MWTWDAGRRCWSLSLKFIDWPMGRPPSLRRIYCELWSAVAEFRLIPGTARGTCAYNA